MAPDDLPLLLLQASSAKQAGNTELYKTALQRAISSHPGAPGPRALMARQVLERNDPEKALAILAELPETEHSGVLASRAEAYFRLNRLSESRRDLEALARLFPNSIDIQVQLARIYDATGDKTSLNASLNRIRELAPNDKRAVLAKAQLDIASGRPEDARSLLESNGLQPADDPLVLEVWMGLARSEKDRAGEIAYARRLAELQPTSRRVLLLNRAQQRAGAQDEAKRVLLEWLDRHPDDVSILAELANLYIGTGEIDKSIEQLRRINSLDANNAYALNNLAWYLRKTSPTEAKEFAERAIETAPDESIVVDTYAVVLSEQRNYDQALRVLQSAIDRGGQVAALRLRRAEILRLKGDLDGAVKELETLMESAPPPAVRERAKKQLVELALPPN
jgi:tetratricopeptide (TPR) repeat protein